MHVGSLRVGEGGRGNLDSEISCTSRMWSNEEMALASRLQRCTLNQDSTGAYTKASARGYDAEGVGAQMLEQLEIQQSMLLEEVTNNLRIAQDNVDHFSRPEIRSQTAHSDILQFQSELAYARLVAAQRRDYVIPMIQEMKNVVTQAIRDGVFAFTQGQLQEQQQHTLRNIEQLLQDTPRLIRDVYITDDDLGLPVSNVDEI